MSPGTLYLIGTPIGNLEDITLRALRLLGEVDLIAAEDTRVTRVLLRHYEIDTPVVSYHTHSGAQKLERLLGALGEGKSIALVSDAGMPGVSDPGARLVQACAERALPVAVVPGPTAASAALAISGLPAKEFLFLGFLPPRSAARRESLRKVADQRAALILYEAPHRLLESLVDTGEVLGDRQAACCRELTKRFEEVVRGTVSELIAHFSDHEPRGEFTIVVAGGKPERGGGDVRTAQQDVLELISAGLSPSRAAAHVARKRGLPKSALYRAAVEQERAAVERERDETRG
jgi:16S rRNA (cytidine1402-2'-O)-methyltransferase